MVDEEQHGQLLGREVDAGDVAGHLQLQLRLLVVQLHQLPERRQGVEDVTERWMSLPRRAYLVTWGELRTGYGRQATEM